MKRFNLSLSRTGILHDRGRGSGMSSQNTKFFDYPVPARLLRNLATGFVFVALLAGIGNVLAAEEAKEKSKPIPYGDWALQCPGDKNSCSLRQQVLVEIEGKKAPIAAVVFVYGGEPRALHAIIRLPLGIALPRGMILQVDENSPITWGLSHCDREGCLATGKISPELRKSLEAGQKAKVIFHKLDGKPVAVPTSLKGVTAGLRALDKKK